MASTMNLWGNISQQKRIEMTSGFQYDPFLVAAIIRKDDESIKAIKNKDHSTASELSFKQYDFLVREYGLEALANPLIFAYELAKKEMNDGK